MKKKFLIFSPSYKETSGGVVALHKMCSILNQVGCESYLYPYFDNCEINKRNFWKPFYMIAGNGFKSLIKGYKTNPVFNTPIYGRKNEGYWDDWVVVYPEIVFGNPLNAKNVVRWFLHQPGYHTGKIYFSSGELYYKFNSAIDNFSFPGSMTSEKHLKVIHYPLELYNMNNISKYRSGTAYCLRKGRDKPIQHDLENSILIDGKSHEEVSEIFKRVKTFISYDSYTAYSLFAVLCGCESIVIPDEGVSEEEWYPNPTDRYGLSYGFSNVERAKVTAHLVKVHVMNEHAKSVDNVKNALLEINEYFF